jgi:hypothetical protein
MADIFISYSREDREWVERLATQLQSEGFSVWWDWDLLVGKRYRETIDNELQSCKATVVVWSQHSIQSDFVRDEAEEAQQRNVLVPVLKEVVRPPAGFRQIQTADLSTWTGAGDHAEFRRVLRGVASLVGQPAGDKTATSAKPTSDKPEPATNTPTIVSPVAATQRVHAPLAVQSKPPILSQIAATLPPLSPRTWRYLGFGAAGLIGILLIASQFTTSGQKPAVPPIGANNSTPRAAVPANSGDEADIGQTGPRNAGAAPGGGHAGNDNSDTGNQAGDSGDVGQGNPH